MTGSDRVFQYVDEVNSGAVLACDAIKKAVKRFESDIAESQKRRARWVYDEPSADKMIRNIERLKHFEDPFAGKLIHLEPWECFFIGQLYGWLDRKTRIRRFKKALLFMGRKQGKTIIASAITIMEVLTRKGIEAYTLATKQLIANKSFRNIEQFVKHNPLLVGMFEIRKSPKIIECPSTNSIYMPLSSDSSLDGLNVSVAVIDELAAQEDGGEKYRTLTSGMGTRTERLTIIISTAAASVENPLVDEYEYAKLLLDGTQSNDEYLVAIYEYDKEDRWDDLTKMQKSCPNIGVSVQADYYEAELKTAKMIPRQALEYKTKYCNLWQSPDNTWIPDALWTRCRSSYRKHQSVLTPERLATCPCIISLDFSSIWDWTAMTAFYYVEELDKYYAEHRFFIPGDQVEAKTRAETSSLTKWIEDGVVTPTPGEIIDYEYVYKAIDEALVTNNVLAICFDPAKAQDFARNYESRATIVPFAQRPLNIGPAAERYEKAIVNGQIMDGNPAMRWMVSCAVSLTNAAGGIYLITKPKAGKHRKRIDGVVTSFMGFAMLQDQMIAGKTKPKIFDLSQISY